MKKQRILEVLPYLPESIRERLQNVVQDEWIDIEEIRLRAGLPLCIGVWGESCFVTNTGGITNYESDAYTVTTEEVQAAFMAICENSVYAYIDEIRQGFITLRGGHRVGICGKTVIDNGKIKTFKEVSSLNFRVASQIIGLADGIIDRIVYGTEVFSTLIVSPPQMGKTTLLRDIMRQVSNKGFKCGVADDRGELCAIFKGAPTNFVGAQTDIIDSAPKADAIEMLIRTMSPKVLITDEIASDKDVEAIRKASGTGVKIIATTHGDSIEEVKSRKMLLPLFEDKIFYQSVLLRRDFSTPDSVTYTKVSRL